MCSGIGWMAERSKALVSGTSLFGGEGSNPSSVTTFLPRGKLANLTQFSKLAPLFMSRLAQLVERKTLNLVVVGSSPTVGIPFWSLWHGTRLFFFFWVLFSVLGYMYLVRAVFSLLWRSWQRVGLIILRSRVRSSPGAVIFFPLGKNLRRFVVFVFGPLAVVLVGWPSGPRR